MLLSLACCQRRLGAGLPMLAFTLLLLLLPLSVRAQQSNVLAWGDQRYGALGDGYALYLPHPALYPTGLIAVATGYHTVALRADGTVWTVGLNSNGQLGDGTIVSRSTPVQGVGKDWDGVVTRVSALAAGSGQTL